MISEVFLKNRSKLQQTMVLSFIAFAFLRCESSGSGTPVNIPLIEIDCTSTKCSAVASGGYEVTINITKSGCAANQIEFEPIVDGVANITCVNGTGCSGSVTSWRDNQGQATSTILSNVYYVCGWLDLDPGAKNPNDAFAEENLSITSAPITLSDWGATNYFFRKRLPQP